MSVRSHTRGVLSKVSPMLRHCKVSCTCVLACVHCSDLTCLLRLLLAMQHALPYAPLLRRWQPRFRGSLLGKPAPPQSRLGYHTRRTDLLTLSKSILSVDCVVRACDPSLSRVCADHTTNDQRPCLPGRDRRPYAQPCHALQREGQSPDAAAAAAVHA